MDERLAGLEARLLDAHARDDRWALVELYDAASRLTEDPTGTWFFLTHAYVFALETAHPALSDLEARLLAAGRV